MFHKRKNLKKYRSFGRPDQCDFCKPDILDNAVLQTAHAYVIPNRVAYNVWEMRNVTDHLMVIPKKHVQSVKELSDAAKLEIFNIIGDYESHHYNVYARAAKSAQRSVAHQHTHLIKTDNKKARAFLYLAKPYLLLKF